jgi:hypothetical protein
MRASSDNAAGGGLAGGDARRSAQSISTCLDSDLEFELIQTQMAQKYLHLP